MEFIRSIADTLEGETIFFLDAHWYCRCPLLEELEAIASHGLQPAVIAIHDFKTDHPDELGFDFCTGQPFTLDWSRPSVEKIYGDDWSHEYNVPSRAGVQPFWAPPAPLRHAFAVPGGALYNGLSPGSLSTRGNSLYCDNHSQLPGGPP